jgi:outer membrane protein assembly factor BamD (BamD/ComL family)
MSEMQIGDFYMDREEYQSAAERYRGILDGFPGLGLDADALFKLGTCYQKMNLDDRAEETFQIILKHFEGTEVADAAQDAIPAAN